MQLKKKPENDFLFPLDLCFYHIVNFFLTCITNFDRTKIHSLTLLVLQFEIANSIWGLVLENEIVLGFSTTTTEDSMHFSDFTVVHWLDDFCTFRFVLWIHNLVFFIVLSDTNTVSIKLYADTAIVQAIGSTIDVTPTCTNTLQGIRIYIHQIW